MQHLINRQSIHVYLTKGADAFQVQQHLSAHYWNDVVPLLASLFDKLSDSEEVIRIDRIEIDLGVLSEKEINQTRWDDAILSKIRKQLYEKIGGKQRSPLVIREPKIISICRQWLFYMQKGYLPWNAVNLNNAWYDTVLETLAVDFTSITEFRRLIKAHPVVTHRIVAQHREDFVVKLIEILTAHNHQDLPRITEGLHQIFSGMSGSGLAANVTKAGKSGIWLLLIREAARTEKALSSQALVEKILRRHWPDTSDLHSITNEDAPGHDIILPIIDRLKKGDRKFSPGQREIDSSGQIFHPDKNDLEGADSVSEEGIFVQYGGVVLLHPFLSSLFKRLQLVNEGTFKNENAQQKAMYLIYYMATGRTLAEEYELSVAKVLCAWPMEMPVEKNIELSTDELNESDAMLQAAIEQWTVLKNTSVAGLREGFLQRSGKLFTKTGKLYLRVEDSSLDVLLDQLPWHLGIIKLPWMKEMLWVDWR